MNAWDKAGVPHLGWQCVGVNDLGEASHTCEMCGHEQIRYVHTMTHEDHDKIDVGCICASKMAVGYRATEAEADLKNRENRRQTFRYGWNHSAKGNFTRVKNSIRVTIGPGKFGGFWVSVGKEFLPGYPKTFEEACDEAFDYIDPLKHIGFFR